VGGIQEGLNPQKSAQVHTEIMLSAAGTGGIAMSGRIHARCAKGNRVKTHQNPQKSAQVHSEIAFFCHAARDRERSICCYARDTHSGGKMDASSHLGINPVLSLSMGPTKTPVQGLLLQAPISQRDG
jgi:hypothetical protein